MILKQLITIPKVVGFLVFMSILIMFYFTSATQETQRFKPQNIPLSSQWVGGQDGGDWISCKELPKLKMECSIFNEITGELAETAVFAIPDAKKHSSTLDIDFYDGDKIVTMDGEIFLKNKSDNQ